MQVCPHCGFQNTNERKMCKQCRRKLATKHSPQTLATPLGHLPPTSSASPGQRKTFIAWWVWAILGLISMCAVGASIGQGATPQRKAMPTAVSQVAALLTPIPVPATLAPTTTPIPTATARPVLTPTPLPEIATSKEGNVRSEPRIVAGTIRGQLCAGDQVNILKMRLVNADAWYYVRITHLAEQGCTVSHRLALDDEGWINQVLLPKIDDSMGFEILPAMTVEPTARPLPTSKPLPTVRPAPVISGGRTGAVCRDGTRSNATGRGACSHHGGVDHWLYGP